jgi:hypothetical protein
MMLRLPPMLLRITPQAIQRAANGDGGLARDAMKKAGPSVPPFIVNRLAFSSVVLTDAAADLAAADPEAAAA